MTEVIAEAGVGHGGDIDIALKMVDAARAAKVDIVKFQTYNPVDAIHPSHTEYKLLETLALSHPAFIRLARYCEQVGIEFLSTPGDLGSLKFLVEECGVKRIKIGSDDLTYPPLIEAAWRTRLPLLISTGMATLAEVSLAITNIPGRQFTLLHCVSAYPCAPEDANLKAMDKLQWLVDGRPVGYSDHTKGTLACLAAAARGASVIEKHFELRYGAPSVDHAVSIHETQLAEMVHGIRQIEKMLGSGEKVPCAAEMVNIPLVRKKEDGRKCA